MSDEAARASEAAQDSLKTQMQETGTARLFLVSLPDAVEVVVGLGMDPRRVAISGRLVTLDNPSPPLVHRSCCASFEGQEHWDNCATRQRT